MQKLVMLRGKRRRPHVQKLAMLPRRQYDTELVLMILGTCWEESAEGLTCRSW